MKKNNNKKANMKGGARLDKRIERARARQELTCFEMLFSVVVQRAS